MQQNIAFEWLAFLLPIHELIFYSKDQNISGFTQNLHIPWQHSYYISRNKTGRDKISNWMLGKIYGI